MSEKEKPEQFCCCLYPWAKDKEIDAKGRKICRQCSLPINPMKNWIVQEINLYKVEAETKEGAEEIVEGVGLTPYHIEIIAKESAK